MDSSRFDGLEIDATGSVVCADPLPLNNIAVGGVLPSNDDVAPGRRVRKSSKQQRRESAEARKRERMWNSPYNTYFAEIDGHSPARNPAAKMNASMRPALPTLLGSQSTTALSGASATVACAQPSSSNASSMTLDAVLNASVPVTMQKSGPDGGNQQRSSTTGANSITTVRPSTVGAAGTSSTNRGIVDKQPYMPRAKQWLAVRDQLPALSRHIDEHSHVPGVDEAPQGGPDDAILRRGTDFKTSVNRYVSFDVPEILADAIRKAELRAEGAQAKAEGEWSRKLEAALSEARQDAARRQENALDKLRHELEAVSRRQRQEDEENAVRRIAIAATEARDQALEEARATQIAALDALDKEISSSHATEMELAAMSATAELELRMGEVAAEIGAALEARHAIEFAAQQSQMIAQAMEQLTQLKRSADEEHLLNLQATVVTTLDQARRETVLTVNTDGSTKSSPSSLSSELNGGGHSADSNVFAGNSTESSTEGGPRLLDAIAEGEILRRTQAATRREVTRAAELFERELNTVKSASEGDRRCVASLGEALKDAEARAAAAEAEAKAAIITARKEAAANAVAAAAATVARASENSVKREATIHAEAATSVEAAISAEERLQSELNAAKEAQIVVAPSVGEDKSEATTSAREDSMAAVSAPRQESKAEVQQNTIVHEASSSSPAQVSSVVPAPPVAEPSTELLALRAELAARDTIIAEKESLMLQLYAKLAVLEAAACAAQKEQSSLVKRIEEQEEMLHKIAVDESDAEPTPLPERIGDAEVLTFDSSPPASSPAVIDTQQRLMETGALACDMPLNAPAGAEGQFVVVFSEGELGLGVLEAQLETVAAHVNDDLPVVIKAQEDTLKLMCVGRVHGQALAGGVQVGDVMHTIGNKQLPTDGSMQAHTAVEMLRKSARPVVVVFKRLGAIERAKLLQSVGTKEVTTYTVAADDPEGQIEQLRFDYDATPRVAPDMYTVVFENSALGMGIGLGSGDVIETESGLEQLPVIVDEVLPGSAAEAAGVTTGDMLVLASHTELAGIGHDSVVALLRSAPRPMTCVFQRQYVADTKPSNEPTTGIQGASAEAEADAKADAKAESVAGEIPNSTLQAEHSLGVDAAGRYMVTYQPGPLGLGFLELPASFVPPENAAEVEERAAVACGQADEDTVVVVQNVTGQSQVSGVCCGDRIEMIESWPCSSARFQGEVADQISRCARPLRVLFHRPNNAVVERMQEKIKLYVRVQRDTMTLDKERRAPHTTSEARARASLPAALPSRVASSDFKMGITYTTVFRQPKIGLGFTRIGPESVRQYPNGTNDYLRDGAIVVGSVNGESDREGVLPGDVILSVNGTVLTGLTQDAVLNKLQRAPRPMQVIFARQAAAGLISHEADHKIVKTVTFGEGQLGLGFSKEAVDGLEMAFVVQHVSGQSVELGISQGDIIMSVGAQKLDGSEKEEDVVLQIQNSQRPLEITFSSNIDHSSDPDAK